MSSQRKIGALLGYTNIIVKNIVNLVYTPMLLSFVGQADYGVFQTSNSFIFSLSLLTFGFSEAYIRFYTQKKVNGSQSDIKALNGMYLMLYAIICTVVLAVGMLFAANVDHFFSGGFTINQIELARVLMSIMTVNVTATLFSTVFDAYILAHEQFRFQQTRQLFTSMATPFIAYLLLSMGMGAVGVAVSQLIVNLSLLALNAKFAIYNLEMRFDLKRFDGVLFKSIAVFSAWIFANQVCELVNQSVPNILLGALTGAVTVSVYAVSIQIRGVFVSLSTVMSTIFVPKINQIVATSDDNQELTNLMTTVGRYQMILFCWVYCGFLLLGKFFISKWAGDAFIDSYYLICAMTLPLGVPLCQNTGIEIQRAKNKHRARSLVYLVMSGINVIFTWVAAPYLGYWAPAIAYIVSIIFGNGIFMNWYYHARIGLDMIHFWKNNFPIIISAGSLVVACFILMGIFPVSNWFSFFLWGISYSALFALVVWFFVFNPVEKVAVSAKFSNM